MTNHTVPIATAHQQGDLLDLIPRPGDPGDEVRAICALLTGDPVHERDRDRIVSAILRDGRSHQGEVDPGRVREMLCDTRGNLVVNPRVLSATYQGLSARGVIRFLRWTTSTDVVGRNRGKPARVHTLIASDWDRGR